MTTTPEATSAATPEAAPGAPGTPATSPAPPPRGGLLLFTLLAAQFMNLLDVFIVNVAAPTVRSDLGASGGALQLVVAGYTITYAVLLVTGARLGGRFGPGRLFQVGLATFTLTSLACGLAATSGQLITFRFLQGAGAALLLPQVLSLIQRTFTGADRARALSTLGAVIATGAAAGQVVGGVLVSADLFGWGWRPVFLVNVPLGLALLVLGARVVPMDRPGPAERTRQLDLPGLALLTAAVLAFTVPLVLGPERDWPTWCWVSLAGSVLLFAWFVWFESVLARRGGAPLLSPRVLRSPGMSLAVVRIALVMSVNAGLMFMLSLHIQGPEAGEGLGYGALRAGLSFLPTAVMFGVGSLAWRGLPAGWRPYLVPVGLLTTAASTVTVGLLLRHGDPLGPAVLLLLGVNGAGMALAYSPLLVGALASVRPADAADASGLTGTMTQLGMLVGTATFGTLFLQRTESTLSTADGLWATTLALGATCVVIAALGALREARPRA